MRVRVDCAFARKAALLPVIAKSPSGSAGDAVGIRNQEQAEAFMAVLKLNAPENLEPVVTPENKVWKMLLCSAASCLAVFGSVHSGALAGDSLLTHDKGV